MWWMMQRAPIHYVVHDVASTICSAPGPGLHYPSGVERGARHEVLSQRREEGKGQRQWVAVSSHCHRWAGFHTQLVVQPNCVL